MFERVELIKEIIFIILIIFSLIIIFSNNNYECPRDSGTFFSLITGIACRYGISGVLIFLITIILFFHLLIKYVNRQK